MDTLYFLPTGVTASNLAHLYSRVSSATQLTGDGLSRQIAATDEWVRAHDLTIVKTYTDRGVSAFRGKNRREGELATIFKAIEAGVIKAGEHLIIENVDRLSRQEPTEAITTLHAILKKGVIVHSVFDRRIFTFRSVNEDPGILLTLVVSMARANEESRIKSSRVKAAYAARREKGQLASARVPSWCEVLGKKDCRQVVLIPEKVALLKRIFEMAAGGLSAYAIAATLNREGVPTLYQIGRKDRRWQSSGVLEMLKSRAVIGEHTSDVTEYDAEGKRKLIPTKTIQDFYPRAIDAALFLRVQDALSKRKVTRQRGATGKDFANILRGLVSCEECGSVMRIKVSPDNRKKWPNRPSAAPCRFFRCSGREEATCGHSTIHAYDPLEAGIIDFVEEVPLSNNQSVETAGLESTIGNLVVERDALMAEARTLIENGGLSKLAIKMAAEREHKAEALDRTVAELKDKLALLAVKLTPADRQHAVVQLRAKLEQAEPGERQQIRAMLNATLQQVISKVTFNSEGYVYVYLHDKPHTQYRFYDGKYIGVRRANGRVWPDNKDQSIRADVEILDPETGEPVPVPAH